MGNKDENSKILVIFTHPQKKSLVSAVKDSVVKGLHNSGAEVSIHDLYEDKFDPLLHDIEENDRDPVTLTMQRDILWADGLVFVSPLWWANVPAMLKGYFDRVFTEHFAFEYNQASLPVGLLKNKKALLVGTCDTPAIIARLGKTSLGYKAVVKGILKLSGIQDTRFTLFGSVLNSTEDQRKKWLNKAEIIGEKFGRPDGTLRRLRKGAASFVKAVRLPLYSFVFASVLLGASIGASIRMEFHWARFALAAFLGLLCHAAVSLSNEASDEQTDRINPNRTPFSGGTGLLAEGRITRKTLHWGWIVSTLYGLALAGLFVFLFKFHPFLLIGLAAGLFLGLGYSLPPLKLSRRGLGEIAAFLGYGVPMMWIGLSLQADSSLVSRVTADHRFFLLALPLSLAVFVTLCLTQIPDIKADRTQGRRSIAVLIGPKAVMRLSVVSLCLCIGICLVLFFLDILPLKYALLTSLLPVFTLVMLLRNLEAYKLPAGMTMINLMGMAATSTVLCGVIPAVYFLNNQVQLNPF